MIAAFAGGFRFLTGVFDYDIDAASETWRAFAVQLVATGAG
jgi:6-phosphogluconate dehydrogenase (decarboxylating)